MKRILLLTIVSACSLLLYKPAAAQFQASINIGVQPEWGPSGYDYAENYYLPDVEAYYSVPRHQFVYLDRGNWVFSSSLPSRCGNYDLYNGYKVVINERNPWSHFNDHRMQYANYRFRGGQTAWRDFRGQRGYDRREYNDRRFEGRDYSRNNYDRRRESRYDDRRHDEGRHDRGHDRW